MNDTVNYITIKPHTNTEQHTYWNLAPGCVFIYLTDFLFKNFSKYNLSKNQ